MSNIFNQTISDLIVSGSFYVLRDRQTGMALNTSFTKEGLKWSTDRMGRLIMYPKGRLVVDTVDGETKLEIRGNLTPSNRVYTELFTPKTHTSSRNQIAEYQWSNKALKLMYRVAEPRQQFTDFFDVVEVDEIIID